MRGITEDNRFYFERLGLSWCLSAVNGNTFRLQSVKGDVTDDSGAAQQLTRDLNENRSFLRIPLTAEENNGATVVTADNGIGCEISDKEIRFKDKNGIVKETITGAELRDKQSAISFSITHGKMYFGSGERFDAVNQYGKRLDLYSEDKWCGIHGNSYCPIPFVLTTDNTGIYINRFEHQVFDVGKTDGSRFTVTITDAPVDLYVIIEKTPAEVIRRYCEISGFAPVPPEWMFGTTVCRYKPDFSTPEGVLLMAENMEKHRLPWNAVIIEGWQAQDTSRHADMKKLADKIHTMGRKMLIYEPCGRIRPDVDRKFNITDDDAIQGENGAEIRETRSHNPADHKNVKTMKCIDLTNPDACDKWAKMWDYYCDEIGVDGAKIDFCEQLTDDESIRFYDGRKPAGMHHAYPVVFNTLMYRRFNEKKDGGMNFSRGGGIGAQRYPFMWAGDQRREFKYLRAVLNAALSAGLSGIPYLSWDTAGYRMSFNPYDLIHEKDVFLRGVQLSAFSANIQTHGNVKRPYDFDEKTIAVYRKYAVLHDRLRPYLLKCAREISETGIPLMRHLFLYDDKDTKCRESDDEYMLGDALLVAPVLTRKKKRDIYLPQGQWQNIFTGKRYTGPCNLYDYPVPIDEIPVFLLESAADDTINNCLTGLK